MIKQWFRLLSATGLSCIGWSGTPADLETNATAPKLDHHQHLLSPLAAQLLNNPQHAIRMPASVADMLRELEESWNDPNRLSAIYSADAVVLNDEDHVWLRGREEVAKFVSTRFANAYSISPVAYTGDEQRGRLAVHEGAAQC